MESNIKNSIKKLFLISDENNFDFINNVYKEIIKTNIKDYDIKLINYSKVNFIYNSKHDKNNNNLIEFIVDIINSNKNSSIVLIHDDYLGISIEINKYKEIICSSCSSVFEAKATKDHNNSNVLVASSNYIGSEVLKEIIFSYIEKEFSYKDNHFRRVEKLVKY